MSRRWSGTLALLCTLAPAAVPVALQAQEMKEDGPMRVFSFNTNRPRIGVVVDYRADAEKDKVGARVNSVTPDGPADKAGIQAGDIITRFNGTALGGAKPEDADDDDTSGPAQKLVKLAGELSAGDTVKLEYRRDGATRTATLVAANLGGMSMGRGFQFSMPDMPRMRTGPEGMPRMPMIEGDGNTFRLFSAAPDGLQLTELSPDLGEYFGTKDGLLVLKAEKRDGSDLRAGDVILSIDGRHPSSVDQARRILGTYDKGDTARLEIMRKQKKMTITWTAPERNREFRWKVDGQPERVRVERS